MSLQEKINQTEEYGTIDLEFDEYCEQVSIAKPITIIGNNSTICAGKGPVVTVDSKDVILKDLRIEITSSPDSISDEESYALMVKENIGRLDNVVVKGNIKGVVNEEGIWHYPDVLNIWPVAPGVKNYFEFSMDVPVSCALETDIADLTIANPGLSSGKNTIKLEIEGLKKDIVLFGHIYIKSTYLTRIIGISGGSFGVPEDLSPKAEKPICLDEPDETKRRPSKESKQSSKDDKKPSGKIDDNLMTKVLHASKNQKIVAGIALFIFIVFLSFFLFKQTPTKESEPGVKSVTASSQTKQQDTQKEERDVTGKKDGAGEDANEETGKIINPVLEKQLNQAKQYIQSGQYVSPPKQNAFEIYEKLFKEENENNFIRKESIAGLEAIFSIGEKLFSEKNLEKASEIFSKLKTTPHNEIRKKSVAVYQQVLNEIKKIEAIKANKEKQQRLKDRLAQAKQYYNKGHYVSPSDQNAYEIYERLLKEKDSSIKDASVKGLEDILEKGEKLLKEENLKDAIEIFSVLKNSNNKEIQTQALNKYQLAQQKLTDLESSEETKRQLEKLLDSAQGYMESKQYVLPENQNAYDIFEGLLSHKDAGESIKNHLQCRQLERQ